MTVNRAIIIACAVVGVAFVAFAFVAGAQTSPAGRVVRVAAAPVAPAKVTASTVAANAGAVAPVDSGRLVSRETYSYLGTGRRDPFVSLMNTEELRPLFQDLKLVAVAWDANGRNSVAVLRDVTSKIQYRVKVGRSLAGCASLQSARSRCSSESRSSATAARRRWR
jgi:hypothetical protein